MEHLLRMRSVCRWAILSAAITAIICLCYFYAADLISQTVSQVVGVIPAVEAIKASAPFEVIQNCGPVFATSILTAATFGFVYAMGIYLCTPRPQSIRSESEAFVRELDQAGRNQADPGVVAEASPSPDGVEGLGSGAAATQDDADVAQSLFAEESPTGGVSETSNEESADSSASPTVSPSDHTGPAENVTDPASSHTNESHFPEGDSTPSEQRPTKDPTDRQQSPATSQQAPPGAFQQVPQEMWDRLHPWLLNRLSLILPTLTRQGPEAAREENRVAAECDESDIACALIPSQICEWIMPLLGFIGTVWGLHMAIRPLSEGVEQMMKAVGRAGSEEMRQEAMILFTDGFSGLKIAFDTTLLGLVGVVAVGFMLFLSRRRAMRVLGEVQWTAEEIVRAVSTDSLSGLLRNIAGTLNAGLMTDQDGRSAPRLAAFQETVRQGLMIFRGGEGGTVPWFDHVINSVRKNVIGALNVLVRLGAWQLHEDKKQTQLQAQYIAADLRALRRKAFPDEDLFEDLLAQMSFHQVAEHDNTQDIQALAVTDAASAISIGGYNKNAARRFVHEQRIDWLDRALNVELKTIYSEQAQELRSNGDPEAPQTYEPTGDIQGLTYAPKSDALYLACIDGMVRRFGEREMQNFGPLSGRIDQDPFVWFAGSYRVPFLGFWERQQGKFRYKLAAISEDGRELVFSEEVQRFLAIFDHTPNQRPAFRVRADSRLMCLAGRQAVDQPDQLMVCERHGSSAWDVVRRLKTNGAVTAFDVSQNRRIVVFAIPQEGLFRWRFDEPGPPERIVPLRRPRPVSHLFLNEDGHVFVAVCGDEVLAHVVDRPQCPRTFETYGASVTHAARSLNRSSIALATDRNGIWLLTFREPL